MLSLELSETQLARGMPLNYTIYDSVSSVPVSSEEYFVLPNPGVTKTRQVLSFGINDTDVDLVLEINSAQTCNIYYRTTYDQPAAKVLPLPGSEGVNENFYRYYARAGDVLVVDQLYVIIANYLGNNTVYSFSTDVFYN